MAERALLVVAMLLLSTSARADEEAAKKAEGDAFDAIDEERWCDAMGLFLAANDSAPSVDLIFNAALAADEAQDRKRALKLYVELLGAYPDTDRGEAVNTRIAELTATIQKDGDGTPCPEPDKLEEPAPEPDPPAPVAEPVKESPPAPGVSSVLPWTVAGAGGVLLAAGAAMAVVGVLPYLDSVDAREQILLAEQRGADAGALQDRQAAARGAWTSWGELTMWSGVGAAVLGLGVVTGGVVWGLLGSGGE